MKNIAQVLKALSDENRLRIVMMLKNRPMCVCEINEVLDIALSTISSHLKTLKYAGIIEDKKDGRWIIYKLNTDNEFIEDLLNFLYLHLKTSDIIINKISKKIINQL
jgi:ArsR family transcriptional regulator